MAKSSSSSGRGPSDSIVDANRKFVRQVSELLKGLEETGAGLSKSAQSRLAQLRSNIQEQQDEVLPRLASTISMLEERRDGISERAKPVVRRVVTGREEMSIHDWLNKYTVVKTMDKITYVVSILFLQATQYMSMRFPEYFRFYFALATVFLLSARVYMYGKMNMQYFLYDYCYLTNLLCVINALVQPNNAFFWQINFVAANGPLMWAIVAWRNSLVFHDIDKVTSTFIHFAPALLTYTTRWNLHPSPMCPPGSNSCSLNTMTAFVVPMIVYIAWQAMYLIITEKVDRAKFQQDPSLMTSLRWIVRDKKNSVHHLMVKVGRDLGLLGAEEELDLDRRPAVPIGLFVTFQLIFTILTFLPAPIFFMSQFAHRLLIICVGIVALWNGAGFLFEVFVKRYEDSLQKRSSQPRDSKLQRKSSSSSERRSSQSSSKGDSSSGARAKGFCAAPNAADREELKKSLLSEHPIQESDEEDDDAQYEDAPESDDEHDDKDSSRNRK
mmetsp:Transcript_11365/g.22214  ORF Transcript_11365/g.22214 Transcript_11365/m.22214 type:complete len:497 (-) Transcript_11365:124-1614(-)